LILAPRLCLLPQCGNSSEFMKRITSASAIGQKSCWLHTSTATDSKKQDGFVAILILLLQLLVLSREMCISRKLKTIAIVDRKLRI